MGGGRRVEGLQDLLPDPSRAPALIPRVDGLPGAELRGEIPPGGTSPSHPEHAAQDRPLIVVRAADLGFLWGQKPGHALPVVVREFEGDRLQPLQRGTAERSWLVLCPSSAVTGFGNRLVAASKGRPGEPQADVLRLFGDGEEQASHFGYGQREEVDTPPFSPVVACRRVTSK